MKRTRTPTIRNMVLISMIVAPFIPFVLILSVGFYYFKSAVEVMTTGAMERVAADHRHLIESFLDERRQDLELIGRSYSVDALTDTDTLRRVFENLQKTTHAFVDIGIFDRSGLHVAYCGPYELGGKNYGDADWFKAVTGAGVYVSDVFTGFRNYPHFVVAVLMQGDGGNWVIRATVDSLTFGHLVHDIRMGRTGEAYIINGTGVLQTARRSGGALMEKTGERLLRPATTMDTASFIQGDTDGSAFLYTTAWLNNQSWLLVVRQEKSDAFQRLHTAVLVTVAISLVGGAGIVLVAVLFTDRIARRIERVDAEKAQLNQQLIGASRLVELGEMAAGFAHEINNPLQIIKSEKMLLEMSLQELKDANRLAADEALNDAADACRQIDVQISRCARITQAVLKFGRQSDPCVQPVALTQFIPEIIGMVAQRAADHGIAIRQRLDDAPVRVSIDPTQLQQVFLNLLNNAIDAIIERHGASGGALSVAALSAGDGVTIDIRDNGSGISRENLEKIFSPFFTTKPVGKGTGLGLSVCYGIIKGIGGDIGVTSAPGEGTMFSIHLPAATCP